MTRKRYRKPASPEEVARQVAERRQRDADVAHLRAQPDVRVVVDNVGRVRAASRLDVFQLLYLRVTLDNQGRVIKRALEANQHRAVRRLEEDIAAWKGVDRSSAKGERVQCSAPQGLITDRMIDAGRRVAIALNAVGARDVSLLEALLLPQFDGDRVTGQTLTRWRDTVERVTGETRDECQVAAIRAACENLARGYVRIDYQGRKRA